MRKCLFFSAGILCLIYGCSTKSFVAPVNNTLYKISFATVVPNASVKSWQQVIGGNGVAEFLAISTDTVSASSLKDNIDLKNLAAYTKNILPGKYDITLSTTSTATIDTFIRFKAQLKSQNIDKDLKLSLPATTNDGVITIRKTLIQASTKPSFVPAGSTTAYNFGLSGDYYFLYVKGATQGRVAFTEITSGDVYIQDINVAALNQYDLSTTTDKPASIKVNVSKQAFRLSNYTN